jgi:hypothetical protein
MHVSIAAQMPNRPASISASVRQRRSLRRTTPAIDVSSAAAIASSSSALR